MPSQTLTTSWVLKQLLVQLIPAEAENQITTQALLSLFIYTHMKTTGLWNLSAGLQLPTEPSLSALKLRQFSFLSLLNVRITSVFHHAWLVLYFIPSALQFSLWSQSFCVTVLLPVPPGPLSITVSPPKDQQEWAGWLLTINEGLVMSNEQE